MTLPANGSLCDAEGMTATASLDDDLARHLVTLATLAPSVHNTQPWSFARTGDTLVLRADRSRQLAVLDPDARLLMQSCGAALHHLLVAVHAAGLDAQVELVPDADDRAELVPGRAFVPGTATRPVEPPPAEHPTLVLVLTDGDNPREWLVAGQALSALMLRCTTEGVSVQPIGQVIDVPAARQGLAEALGVLGHPQMLLRLGRGSSVRRTARRSVDDVLTL